MSHYIKLDGSWVEISTFFVKSANGGWSALTEVDLQELFDDTIVYYKGPADEYLVTHVLSISGPASMSGVSCPYVAIYDRNREVTSAATWSIVSGSQYAEISEVAGEINILPGADNSTVILRAEYNNVSVEKPIVLTYRSGISAETHTETVEDESGNTTTTTTTTITDESGNTTTTETVIEVVTNEDGTSQTTEQETVTNPDGSSESNSTTVMYDESGNTTGSQTTQETTNADGSFNGNTTNYDSAGTPTDATNTTGDTQGNVNTQEIEYDENGDSAVTGYVIDTSENSEGTKTYNGDGVNTEYYAFDVTRGFIVDIHFTIDCSNKPSGQNENHHNVLTAKRATPEPWYGFQIRQSNTNKYVQLGTQFATGGNTNTRINPSSTTGNTAEYNLRIIYNPTASTNSFVCIDMNSGDRVYTSNLKFPDIEELKYLKVTVGYAMDANGDPFRYSSIDVKNFVIRRYDSVVPPVISCNSNVVTLTCESYGAEIKYRLNESGDYTTYTQPITITADTIVEAYSYDGVSQSSTARTVCEYEDRIETPYIYCNGELVTITCENTGATIYYRLNQEGSYSAYTSAFTITANTLVEAYAELGGLTSQVASENCIYNPDHDYSLDYLTLDIGSAGTICWASVGSMTPKAIQYSINGGTWTYLTPSSTGSSVSINVSSGDKVRIKGTNNSYATSNANYMGFSGGTAFYNVEGNVMSLVYGDNFIGNSALTGSFNFCSLFKQSNIVSAENLVLPTMVLTPHCYRAMFANSPSLVVAPALPATTLADSCYRYMFQDASISTAPDLFAETLVNECYEGMFNKCPNLNYIKCLAKYGLTANSVTLAWVQYVNATGTFVKDANTDWTIGNNGIPTRWVVNEEGVKAPEIDCDGLSITLECATSGADIYYRLNESGIFTLYSTAIPITADTVVEAFSELNGETSPVVRQSCVYDDGIEEPVIYCDGEYVTISCETMGASIYYKFSGDSQYAEYNYALVVSSDTVCYSYAEIDGRQSEVVSATCIYDESIKAPIIECDGTAITMTCHTVGADIYYKLNDDVSYVQYSSAITISADTTVYAYSELSGDTSEVITETCVYNPYHEYSGDYLTFRVITGGTIIWRSVGSGYAKEIEYSINDGAWTTTTATSAGVQINVSDGDTIRFKGNNSTYAGDKNNYSGFNSGGTATFNIEGNIMSLVYGDNFEGQTAMTGTYNFCSIFKDSNVVSAENLVLPATSLTNYCYRAMFSLCDSLVVAPKLPARTLSRGCYWYMFEKCAITEAPELLAETLVNECYGFMFTGCRSLNYIKCMATSGFNAASAKTGWVTDVASSGTFVKASSVSTSTWGRGKDGIPTNWLVFDDIIVSSPEIYCDVYNNVTITSETSSATIYYRVSGDSSYSTYSVPIIISADTVFEAYAELNGQESMVTTKTCEFISNIPFEASNRNLSKWNYNNQEVTTPYSVNGLDGHSASYAKGTFNFETSFALREAQPTYLWFQHADQSATVYIDDNLVEKHWGGYAAFFVDVSNYIHSGTNRVKVALKNNEGDHLAPANADFNFNATLGNVKLFTSPYIPAMEYGYDGFHITADVASSSATINVKTKVPTGATVTCEIDDGTYHFGASGSSTGDEMVFSATVTNPHLWNGTLDPHLYTVTLEVLHEGVLYHRYVRPYGLRYYKYVINDTSVLQSGDPYTGFLLNGSPYLLRGCCMHDDIEGKGNALNDADYAQTFAIVQELGANFLRLAHYPHPKEVYDWCDRLGIVVQTEGPCVNKFQSTMPSDYYEHLNGQYDDMVIQHYNHPCIMFWGLSNETKTDDKEFAKAKINGYIARIKALDSERMVGYVMEQSTNNPSGYYNDPDADWFGCNIYEGWYMNKDSNDPTAQLNTRVKSTITQRHKALAYSEYGCGGTQHCHSDDPLTTTTRGNYERHDIEFMMWLHEGHIATIRNYPQLMFVSEWQLFNVAVSNRNEGYTVCLDGENTSIDNDLRRLNDKGLVERDHITKKDTFYLYKAEWSAQRFVHICGKDYTKMTDRVIKCYTNDENNGNATLSVNGTPVETKAVNDHIVEFTARNYSAGDTITVNGANTSDTFTF